MLREAIVRITTDYPTAVREPLEQHPLAAFIRRELPAALAQQLQERPEYRSLTVEGTKFVGNWAKTPWLAVLDPRITRTAQRGVYVVIAFSRDFRLVYFALGIGVTNTSPRERLALIAHLQDKLPLPPGFNKGPVVLGTGAGAVQTRYDDAQVYYKSYSVTDLPDEAELLGDLFALLDLLKLVAESNDPEVARVSQGPGPTGKDPSYTIEDVRAAFSRTTSDQWEARPGVEPYWHLVLDGVEKPVKAVYATLTGLSTHTFNTRAAIALFKQLGLTCRDARERSTSESNTGSLVLLGTSKHMDEWLPASEAIIRDKGAVANWWSFRIREDARPLLQVPFFLYLNSGGGQFPIRAYVDQYEVAPSASGIESPWPEITLPEDLHKTRDGDEQSRVFRTWLRISKFERLSPPWNLSHFSAADGLSAANTLLNQNAFGYAYAKDANPTPTSPPGDVEYDTNWLTSTTLLDLATLEEMIDGALNSNGPLVLAGPPGTSKTFTALALVKHLTRGDPARSAVTQFHPGSTYEAFLEGLRPRLDKSDGVRFERQDGLVLRMIKKMREQGHLGDIATPYFIVIDEFNRANLPRVLGELLYAFEYGDHPVDLQYSGGFSLPRNLRFIATMNTADRSIRSIDSALRRRLELIELAPSADVLQRYFAVHELHLPTLLAGFNLLNEKLREQRGRHYTVGHTYFMRPGFSRADLTRVWTRRVQPLIEEYFIDQGDLAEAFSCDAFWPEG